MRGVICWALLAACGRVGFDPFGRGPDDDDGRGDARTPSDGGPAPDAFVGVCPVGTTAPDPISLGGTIVHLGTGSAAAGVAARVSTTLNGATIASGVSGADGTIQLAVPTGGMPIAPYVELSGSAVLTEIAEPNRAYDHDLTGTFGVSTMADLTAAYTAGSEIYASSEGTIYIQVIDCNLNNLANVVLAVAPASTVVYADASGQPDPMLKATSSSAVAFALNVPVGAAMITGTMMGSSAPFARQGATVLQNPTVTVAEVTP
jgi:hypothetical protein